MTTGFNGGGGERYCTGIYRYQYMRLATVNLAFPFLYKLSVRISICKDIDL